MMRSKLLLVLIGVAGLIASCTSPPPDRSLVNEACIKLFENAPEAFELPEIQRLCAGVNIPTTTTTTSTTSTSTSTTTTSSTTTTVRPTTTTTTTTTPGGIVPNGPSGNFRLAWNDEFNGNSLDLNKWRPNWLQGSDTAVSPPVNTLEDSCFDPGHVRVGGGVVTLTADTNTPANCRTRSGTARYASGLIQTNSDYRFTYGYVEARMNLPGTCSRVQNWPAFWTNGQNWPRDGEIDIMEGLGGSSTWHYHWSGGSNGGRGDHLDCESGWHTFGANWQPGRIDFYYDGRLVGSQTQGVVSTQHYIIVNLALSDEISGPIVVPSSVQVDYVRHFVRA